MPVTFAREGRPLLPPVISTAPASSAQHATHHAPAAGAPGASQPAAASPFAKLMDGLAREASAGEAQMKGALHSVGDASRPLGGAELLALQVGVYRYSEVIDLASKLVDRATSGAKTILQGQ